MTTRTLITSLALGLTIALGGLALSQQAKDGKQVMEVVTEKPEEPTKNVVKTEEEWKKELTPEQYRILREAGTERAFGQVYKEFKEQGEGTYICVGCNTELFTSEGKFDSHCGWPSFYDPANNENVKTVPDVSGGMIRTEVRCAKCDGHLGHLFEGEGFDTPTDQRYCINGSVLRFVPKKAEGGKEAEAAAKEAEAKDVKK
jgi:peptide-methionine (R)-S-oxide reductase